VFRAGHLFQGVARLRVGRSRSILLFVLVTAGVVVGPSVAPAQQVNIHWIDNSGGQASSLIQRATGSTGTYATIAQSPPGVTIYTDSPVSPGTLTQMCNRFRHRIRLRKARRP
jgi:hypothetical protein